MPYQADITRAYNTKLLAAHNAKNIQRLSRQVRQNRGELKCVHNDHFAATQADSTISYKEFTLVEQGTNNYQRDGNHMVVTSLRLRGYVSSPHIDVYVVLAKNGITPSYGDFQPFSGGFVYTSGRNDFKVLAYVRNYSAVPTSIMTSIPLSRTIKFRKGLNVWYNGSATGNGVRNKIFLVVKNNTGAVCNTGFTMELNFRDR